MFHIARVHSITYLFTLKTSNGRHKISVVFPQRRVSGIGVLFFVSLPQVSFCSIHLLAEQNQVVAKYVCIYLSIYIYVHICIIYMYAHLCMSGY